MKTNGSSAQKKVTVITVNRKAHHEYEIFNKYEAGLALKGTEVKALRVHKANVADAYAKVKNGEIWLFNSNIPVYNYASYTNHEPLRARKLLLHHNEIRRISSKLQEQGYTLIPLKLYFSGAKVKIEIALAKGKKLYDKRRDIKQRESKKQLKKIRTVK
jgi:SsrA-binding protein